MKVHPYRFAQASKAEARGRMLREIQTSAAGKRALRECQETLDRPANSDPDSRKLVLSSFAIRLDVFTHELEDLLKRKY